MRLFILINLQKKDKELILVDNREKAKKTRVIRVITRSYGRSNNGKEQDTSESNLTTTQMKKEAQDHLDLEILISNDVNNIIEKRTNKEHSDSNISPTSASSLTTNPMRKITSNFRTCINNLSLFEKFQLGYLILMFIFFILPIVLFKMGNINLFFDIVYAMETAKAVQSAEELFTIKLRTTPIYKNANIPVNDLVAQAKAFRESGLFDLLKSDPNQLGGLFDTRVGQEMIFVKIYKFAKFWKEMGLPITNVNLVSTLYEHTIDYVVSISDEATLSEQKTMDIMDVFYSFLVGERGKTAPDLQEFRSSNIFFGYVVDQTKGELVDEFLERVKRLKAKSTVTTTTAITTPTTTTTTTAPVPSTSATTATTTDHVPFSPNMILLPSLRPTVISWFGHYLDPTIATPATTTTTTTTTAPVPSTSATTATTTAHVPFSPNMILLPSLRPTVISWFGHYLDPTIATPATTTTTTTTTTATIATPATSATPATATTAHIQKEAVVSNIDTSSTSANANGNEPRRSLLVGRRSPEPLDHTKKNFGGIGEHYNNFRNSPYFYHITIGTIAVSAVAIGIVIYNYS